MTEAWAEIIASVVAGLFALLAIWYARRVDADLKNQQRVIDDLIPAIQGTYAAVNSGRMERIEADVVETKTRVREIGENMAAGRERFAAHDKRLERIENKIDRE